MSEAATERGLWSTLREAIRGTHQDLTAIPIRRAVVLLAVPTVLEMSMESLFAIVDIFFVSRLGADAVAAVGLTESMLALVYAAAMGLSSAATAIVARLTGEKEPEEAARAAVQVIGVAMAMAALLGVGGVALAPRLLDVMGADANVVATGATYTAVMLGGSVTIFLLFVINAVFRSAGDAAMAMRSLWLSNILNILLAPFLIFGLGGLPRLGVTGAAIATTASRGIGVLYQLGALGAGRRRVVIARRHLTISLQVVRELVRLATPATMQVLVETASWLALVRIVSSYESEALAGYTIAMRITIFALLPAWGLANAAATLVGQNLGAGSADRARRSVLVIARYNAAFLGLVGLLFVCVPRAVVAVFASDAGVAAIASDALRIVSFGFPFFAFGMVATQAFNGAGDTKTPMLVNIASFWLFKIPLAYFLAKTSGLGPRGVFIAISAAYTLQALIAGGLFWRGSWHRPTSR